MRKPLTVQAPSPPSLASRSESQGEPGGALSYLSSHPVSTERQRRFEAAAEPGRKYRPALDDEEWLALWDICFDGVRS